MSETRGRRDGDLIASMLTEAERAAHDDYIEALAAKSSAELNAGCYFVQAQVAATESERETAMRLAEQFAQDAAGLHGALYLWRIEHGYEA